MQTPSPSRLALKSSCSKDSLFGFVSLGTAYIFAKGMLFLPRERVAAPALFSATTSPPQPCPSSKQGHAMNLLHTLIHPSAKIKLHSPKATEERETRSWRLVLHYN